MYKLLSMKGAFNLLCCILISIAHTATAQQAKQAPTSAELYRTIEKLDSLLFADYNAQNLSALKNWFTKDLEWYQDNGGLLNYATVIKNFGNIFKRPYRLTRTLVPGTLAVSPIKNYGAIETGSHEFRHIENGKEEVGVFKFLMLWRQEKGQWKISRVVSYDH
jgi:Domain of unknown function (DUF4440)